MNTTRRHYLQQNWSVQEDEILKKAVQKYGIHQWGSVQTLLPYKSAQQCQTRFQALGASVPLSAKQVSSALRKTKGNVQLAAQLLGTTKEQIYEKMGTNNANTEQRDIKFSATEREKEQMNTEVAARIGGQSSKFSRKHHVKPHTVTETKDDTIYWEKIARLSRDTVAEIWELYFKTETAASEKNNLD